MDMEVNMAQTVNKQIALKQLKAVKVETELKGGFAAVSNRTNLIKADLAMDYITADGNKLTAGKHYVILKGDSGFKQWNKQTYVLNENEFVLCPESEILGYGHVTEE